MPQQSNMRMAISAVIAYGLLMLAGGAAEYYFHSLIFDLTADSGKNFAALWSAGFYVVGSFGLAYGLARRNATVYWATLLGAGSFLAFSILILSSFTGYNFRSIPVIALSSLYMVQTVCLALIILLLLRSNVRKEFWKFSESE